MSWLTDLFKDKTVDMRKPQEYRALPVNPKNMRQLRQFDEDRMSSEPTSDHEFYYISAGTGTSYMPYTVTALPTLGACRVPHES